PDPAGPTYPPITTPPLPLPPQVAPLHFPPRIPRAWPSFKIHYRYRETFYHITIHNDDGSGGSGAAAVKQIIVDGTDQPDKTVALVDDRNEHNVDVHLERSASDVLAASDSTP